MVYEEILIGLVSGVIVLLAFLWIRVSRLASQSNAAVAEDVRRDLVSMQDQLGSLGGRIDEMARATSQALEDYHMLRKNIIVSAERSLESFGKSLGENLEQNRRLTRTVEEASDRVGRAASEMEDRLTKAVEEQVGGTVTHKLEPLLDQIDKMTSRLEARGASPFKTAQAQILERLRGRGEIGGKHTAWERALKGLAEPEREVAQAALEDLVRKGLVVKKPTNYGDQVSLNVDRMDEVGRVINGEEI